LERTFVLAALGNHRSAKADGFQMDGVLLQEGSTAMILTICRDNLMQKFRILI